MNLLSFLLILCALGVGFYGVSRINDVPARNICFVLLIVVTIFFLLIAAGVVGTATLHL